MQRNTSNTFDVAIVGGGFSGSILAARLLRDTAEDLSVVLIEREPALGRGVAYSTQHGWHLLNVPAGSMSAFPEDPEHFLRWAQTNYGDGVDAETFLPRRAYGQYVESILLKAVQENPGRFESRHDEAIAIDRSSGFTTIQLRSGATVTARKVVLALGNLRPADPDLPGRTQGSCRYFPYAWSPRALENLDDAREILLVGTGLTAVDTAIALRGRGFMGTIHLLSRRGLLPRQHKASPEWPPFWNEGSPRTVRGLLRLIRRQVNAALNQQIGWRAVFDSLRPFTSRIWQSLPPAEKRRFLRHARSHWEVHRHRVAPEIAGLIASQLVNQHFQTHAARILAYEEQDDGVTVTYRDRRTQRQKTLHVERVINCTGPETDCRRLDDPLLSSLRGQGLVFPDHLFLGLQVADNGALIDSEGMPSGFLYTVGPARKGQRWETTAVPEIREQVAEMAKALAETIAEEKTARINFDQLRLDLPLQL